MRLLPMTTAVLSVASILGATVAQAEDCYSLWRERNSYYKEYGYCFKTPAAIREFGNEGCRYYNEANVPFPPSIWDRILEIRQIERAMRCPV